MIIRVAEDVRFSSRRFGKQRAQHLDEALSFPNPERKRALKEMIQGAANMPRDIHLMQRDGDEIVIPRGNLGILIEGLCREPHRAPSYFPTIIDKRISVPIDSFDWEKPTLREDQIPAVQALLDEEMGVFQGPTASGKTVVILETIRQAEERAIIIVGRSSLAHQWIDRAEEHLGVRPGLFGAGSLDDEDDIIIAMQQTLWTRREYLDSIGFWNKFGFVCVDEAHHCKAHTYLHIVSRFPARYRVGVSATPDHDIDMYPLVEAMVGPVVYEVKPLDATAAGVIGQPKVRAVETTFQFDYIETHNQGRCPGQDCWQYGKRGTHRNNWEKLVQALVVDEDRNRLIASKIAGCDRDRCQVVVSRRLKHLDLILDELLALGYPPESIKRLTGKETPSEQEEVRNSATAGTVILSTIADEGLDIPRLDTIHLVFPGRNPNVTRQQVGRIRRLHPDKKTPIVFDYVDRKTIPLKRQYYSRTSKFYFPERMEVTRV